MPSLAIVAVPALAAMALVALLTRPVLTRLPEPALEAHAAAVAEEKVPYADLPTPWFVVGCTVASGLAFVLAALTLPAVVLPMWWVLAVPVLLLVAVDARTTWIPAALDRVSLLALTLAASATFLLARDLDLVGRTLLGAACAWLLFRLVWQLSRRQLGYGDVRLAPLLGAATASVSWSFWFTALLLGSLAGAAYGILLILRRRNRGFAYAPAMLLGPYLACVSRWLLR